MADLSELLKKNEKKFVRKKKRRPWTRSERDSVEEVQNLSDSVDEVSREAAASPEPSLDSPTLDTQNFKIEPSRKTDFNQTQSINTKSEHKVQTQNEAPEKIQTQSIDTKNRHKVQTQILSTENKHKIQTHSTNINSDPGAAEIESPEKCAHKIQTQNTNTEILESELNNEFQTDILEVHPIDEPNSSNTKYKHKDQTQNTNTEFKHKIQTQTDRSFTENQAKSVEQKSDSAGSIPESVGTKYEHKVQTQGVASDKNDPFIIDSTNTKYEHINQTQSVNTVRTQSVHTNEDLDKSTHTVRTQYEHLIKHSAHTEYEHKFVIENPRQNPFFKLRGAKKRIVDFVYDTCISKEVESFLITYEALADLTQIKFSSIKTTTRRLAVEDKLILVNLQGHGPGAKIEVAFCSELLKNYISAKQLSSNTKYEHSINTRSNTTPSSSSSKDLINTTITAEPESFELPAEWVDISTPENIKELGFGLTQIRQIYRKGNLSAEEVQDSLDNFAYDLELGQVRSKGPKIAMLMGILRKGDVYNSEARAQELRTEAERNRQLKAEIEQAKKDSAEMALVEKAKERLRAMSEEEKQALLPDTGVLNVGPRVLESILLGKISEQIEGEGS